MNIILAILPVFIVIACGYGCRKIDFPGGDFWSSAEKFIYFFLLPILFFKATATSEIEGSNIFLAPTIASAGLVTVALLLVATRRLITRDGPAFTSVFQGAVRFNSYVGLALAKPLFGNEGLVMIAIAIGLIVPIINVMCVLVLSMYGKHADIKWKTIGYRIITNPLVVSSCSGILVNFLAIPMHALLVDILEIISRAALPMGLLAVGAGLRIRELKHVSHLVILTCVLKLLLLPLITFGICRFWGVEGNTLGIITLFSALPGATSSYILARQLGGDKELMAGIIAAETLASAFTIPLVLKALEAFAA